MHARTHVAAPADAPLDNDCLAGLAADFATRAGQHDRAATFPFENFEALHRAGFLALPIHREFGGPGAGLLEVCRVIRTISCADASTGLVLAMHYQQHGLQFRARVWPRTAYECTARDAIERGGLINSLQAEPEQGSLAHGGLPRTVAERVGNGWAISGRKTYVTGIPILRWLVVWARTTDDPPQMGTWLVSRTAPGVEIVETWDHLGMRATCSHDVVLNHVEIPSHDALDVRPLEAWRTEHPAHAAWVAVLLSSVYLGIAEAARSWFIGWLHQRIPASLGRPLATLDRFQDAVGQIDALVDTSRRLVESVAKEADADANAPDVHSANLTKLTVISNAIKAVEVAMAHSGNPGLSCDNALERHYRNVLCGRIHNPQDDRIRLCAGRAALGL